MIRIIKNGSLGHTKCFECNSDLEYDREKDVVWTPKTVLDHVDFKLICDSAYIECPVCHNIIVVCSRRSGYQRN